MDYKSQISIIRDIMKKKNEPKAKEEVIDRPEQKSSDADIVASKYLKRPCSTAQIKNKIIDNP